MSNALTVALISLVSCSFVQAQEAPAQGNAQAGAGKVATCAACHGPTGNDSLLPNVPKLGGQNASYLFKQLVEIRDDVRVVPLMKPMVASLSDQDLADIAAHFASVDAPLGAVDEAKRALGEKLYRAGDATIGVAACSACHSVDGKGNNSAGFPALSGQDVAYTELQLKAFRAGERANDAAEIMRTISARLNDTEIAALASYVFGLR
ncbi:MAG: c-type cytochrome [Pseudomonadota bacterium]